MGSIKHAKTSPVPNPLGDTRRVGGGDWNSEHVIDLDVSDINGLEARLIPVDQVEQFRDDALQFRNEAAGSASDAAASAAEAAATVGALAAPGGAELVGTPEGTVQDALDGRIAYLPSYGALRNYNGPVAAVMLTGVYPIAQMQGIAGLFVLDATDTTSLEINGVLIVDALGRRWRRRIHGPVLPQWFGALGDGSGSMSTDCAPTPWDPRFLANWDTKDFVGIQQAIDFAGSSGILDVALPAGNFILSKCLVIKHSNVRLLGAGKYKSVLRQSKALSKWYEDLSDRGQLVVGGRAYGSANYGTGFAWRNNGDGTFTTSGIGSSFNFDIDNFFGVGFSVIGDRAGYIAGGQYTSGPSGPTLVGTQLFQTGVMVLGSATRLAKGHRLDGVFVSGHQKQGIAPCYIDGWQITNCTGTNCGWQFIGTDYGCKNGLIIDCDATDYADGTSENAFADFEAGNGVDYENITLLRCKATSSVAGFLKLHPGTGRAVRNVKAQDCDVNCAGAATFSYLELFGPGTIDNVSIEGGSYVGATKHAFLLYCSGGQSNVSIMNTKKLTASNLSSSTQYMFYLRSPMDGLTIENNKGLQNGIQRVFMQDVGMLCKNFSLRGNKGALTAAATDHGCIYGSYLQTIDWSDNEFTFDVAANITSVFSTNWRSSSTEGLLPGCVKFRNNFIKGCNGGAAVFWFTVDDESNEVLATGNNLDGQNAATNYTIYIRGYPRRAIVSSNILKITNGSYVALSKTGASRLRAIVSSNVAEIFTAGGTPITSSGSIDLVTSANNLTVAGAYVP